MTNDDQVFPPKVQRIAHDMNNAMTALLGNLELTAIEAHALPAAFAEARHAANQILALTRELEAALPIELTQSRTPL